MTTEDPHSPPTSQVVVYLHPDPDVGDAVAAALEGDSFDVLPVDRPEKARELVEERAIDCLVTVFDLPSTDGLSFVRSLRSAGIVTPTVIHAVNGDESVAAAAIDADVAGYVPVPDSPVESVSALAAALDRATEDSTASTAALRRRWQTVESLHDVALQFETCATPTETYRFAVEALSQVLDVYACVIYVADDASLVPKASVGSLPGGWESYGLDEGVAGRTYQTGESSRTGHIQSQSDASPAEDVLRSGISVPVGDFGVMQAVSDRLGAYTEHDRKLAELLAAHVSAAVSRIRSNRELRAERDRFAMLFENVPDAIAITYGPDRRVADVNPAFERAFGFERGELVDEPFDDYLLPDASDAIHVAEEVGTDEVIRDEITRQGTDERREYSFKGFAIEGEETFQEYGIYTDITAQKRRERELRQYKTLVEAVGDPMYVLDADGRVEMVNEAMASVLGKPASAVVGSDPRTFMPAEHVDRGTELLVSLLDDSDRRWDTFEMGVDSAIGGSFIAETKISPLLDDGGGFAGSVGVIRDITRRKERERQIRDLHEGTRDLMAAAGTQAVAEMATVVATEALDLSINGVYLFDESTDALVPVANSERAQDLLGSPPVVEAGEGLMWDAFETGEPTSYQDVRANPEVMNPDTMVRSEAYVPLGGHGLLIFASPNVDDFDDEALALAKILGSNVEAALDRAERETELAARTDELERQNERLDEFAGMVSHDLRNPLTLANGRLELARERLAELTDAPADDIEEHLSEIEWAVDRMETLIEDMLELARTGQPLDGTTAVDLPSVAAAAQRTVDADLAVTVDDSLGEVEASEQRVRALFENSFRNAIDHVGPNVTVTVRRTPGGFAIDDDGPGIPPEHRDSVLETGYTTASDGTGFGLAIVADVAEAHGWELSVEESPEGGARIRVVTDPS
ncbi:PAS domain S-box [Halovivax ruber XH-70]|uniref:histidine kinase n=1 Tax=Halovivax ruber (strain DSM 18193 / JCM 13892 / XH-70) TaxID=797302 RepID=L0IDJ9_HALRX|nr:GAF domain-containing protein [Halovivax ruber]AGB16903.1 PAS domain S-box [Halovivax ruber XH-70]